MTKLLLLKKRQLNESEAMYYVDNSEPYPTESYEFIENPEMAVHAGRNLIVKLLPMDADTGYKGPVNPTEHKITAAIRQFNGTNYIVLHLFELMYAAGEEVSDMTLDQVFRHFTCIYVDAEYDPKAEWNHRQTDEYYEFYREHHERVTRPARMRPVEDGPERRETAALMRDGNINAPAWRKTKRENAKKTKTSTAKRKRKVKK